MKFNTYDELIKYLRDKDLALLEFDIKDVAPAADGQVVSVATDPATPPPMTTAPSTTLMMSTEALAVKFTSFFESPEILFDTGDESVLLVEEYNSIPNSCSTTRVNIGDRELFVGVCEDCNGQAISRFDIVVDGKSYFGKKFRIETDATKYKNTISLNDK